MEVKIPLAGASKSKTTYLSIISVVIGAWAAECYKDGSVVFLDWSLVTVIGLMVVGRTAQMWIKEKEGKK